MTKTKVKIEELKVLIDECETAEKRNSQSLQCLPPPTIETLTRWEEYVASQYLCCAFRDSDDKWNGKWIPFGNMKGGFEYDIQGTHFKNSEAAYICGMFSHNVPEQIEIQKRLIAEQSGFNAKKFIRIPNEGIARKVSMTTMFNGCYLLYGKRFSGIRSLETC